MRNAILRSIRLKEEFVAEYRLWWVRNRKRVLVPVIAFLSLLALLRLGFEFHRLLFDSGNAGAVDLKLLYTLTNLSFSGKPVQATYPAPSLALLWFLMGWVPFYLLRWWWAGMMLVAIFIMIRIFLTAAPVRDHIERIVLGLVILASYPTAVIIGNGQVSLHIMLFVLSGIVLVHQNPDSKKIGLLASLLLLFSLGKPHLSVPFFWIVLLSGKGIGIVCFVAVIYTALGVWLYSFQSSSVVSAFSNWVRKAAGIDDGYANIHNWLQFFGLQTWSPAFSLALFSLLGIWVYRNRHADIWVLLGVTAIIARIWTYHRLFDDLLILIPMIALFRIARHRSTSGGAVVVASILLILSCISLLQPGTLLTIPPPWGTIFRTAQTILWISVLFFLILEGRTVQSVRNVSLAAV